MPNTRNFPCESAGHFECTVLQGFRHFPGKSTVKSRDFRRTLYIVKRLKTVSHINVPVIVYSVCLMKINPKMIVGKKHVELELLRITTEFDIQMIISYIFGKTASGLLIQPDPDNVVDTELDLAGPKYSSGTFS